MDLESSKLEILGKPLSPHSHLCDSDDLFAKQLSEKFKNVKEESKTEVDK